MSDPQKQWGNEYTYLRQARPVSSINIVQSENPWLAIKPVMNVVTEHKPLLSPCPSLPPWRPSACTSELAQTRLLCRKSAWHVGLWTTSVLGPLMCSQVMLLPREAGIFIRAPTSNSLGQCESHTILSFLKCFHLVQKVKSAKKQIWLSELSHLCSWPGQASLQCRENLSTVLWRWGRKKKKRI